MVLKWSKLVTYFHEIFLVKMIALILKLSVLSRDKRGGIKS